MPVFTSWEPSSRIINVKPFSFAGKHQIWSDQYVNAAGLAQAKGTAQSETWR